MTTQPPRFCATAAAIAALCFTAPGAMHPVYAHMQAKSSSQARYVSKSGFSFAVPPKWQRDDADISMERTRYVLTNADGTVVASIKISTLRDKADTPDSLAEHIRQTVKENTGTILIVRDKTVTVNKAPGFILETNNTRPSEPDTEMTLLTAHSGITGQVVLDCKTADRTKYAPVFDKVVSTFKWQ